MTTLAREYLTTVLAMWYRASPLVLCFCLLFTYRCIVQEMLNSFSRLCILSSLACPLPFFVLCIFRFYSLLLFHFTWLFHIIRQKQVWNVNQNIIVCCNSSKVTELCTSFEIWYLFLSWLNRSTVLELFLSFLEWRPELLFPVQVKFHSQEVWKFQILRSQSSALLITQVYPAFSRTTQWR